MKRLPSAPRRAAAIPARRLLPSLVVTLLLAPVLAALLAPAAHAQQLDDRVSEHTLANGMRVLFVEQGIAPVISFNLMFAVGGIDEPPGLGGIAHMAEHMAFKGTSSIGSFDISAERAALAKVEVLALALEQARKTGDPDEIARLQAEFDAARAEAQQLALPNALDNLFSANGAVGLNAGTGYDFTQYVVSLPSNRLELYARIYADVLLDTVFRGFYEERDVVREERRQRSEDDPNGVLREAFLRAAFERSPYGRPLIGEPQEIESYLATEAEAFFRTFYVPEQAVLVMVGDVSPERDLPILERYFGVIPAGHAPLVRLPAEPPQQGERRVTVSFDAEPQVMVGYHKPTYPARDAYVLDLVDALLTNGRTSRLFRRMVLGDQIALSVSSTSALPGIREDNLFTVIASPRFPNTTEDLEAALYEELERLQSELVSADELQKVKNQVRANTIRSLASGSGLAASLAFHELFAGGWENLILDLEIYDSITAEEIRDVARRTFVPENRVVATLVSNREGSQP